jgi:uncharacterized membrane protein YccF (DUF307 family)
MSLFNTILTEITNKLNGVASYKDDVAQVVGRIIGIPISTDQLSIKGTTLYISLSPTAKSVVRIKQVALQQALKQYKITTIV